MGKPVVKATPPDETVENVALHVTYQWTGWRFTVTEESSDQPLYIVETRRFIAPHAVFKTASDGVVFALGSLNYVSIHAKYDFYGKESQLKAFKRMTTGYTHLSHAYSDTDTPMTMTWTTTVGAKNWDFVCVDDKQEAVARFNTCWYAVKKLGKIEFLGPKATNRLAREEIVVVATTLWYMMVLRMSNLGNLFGLMFSGTGRIEAGNADGTKPQSSVNAEQARDVQPLRVADGKDSRTN